MNVRNLGRVVGSFIVFLALATMPISAYAAQQHKPEGGGGGHESRPSHEASPNRGGGHPSAPSHEGSPNRGGGPSHNNSASRPSGGQSRPSGGNAGNRGNVSRPPNAGNRPGNVGGNRPGSANRPANFGGNRGATANRSLAGRAPGRTVALRGGGSANFRPNGQVRSVNRNGMQINNGLHGGRTVVSEHNGVRVVNTAHGGYVQHAYVTRGGVNYYSRTYVVNNVYHTGIYRGYFYHGFHYYGYYPGVWFHPGFYGWGWHPWGVGIYWGAGIGGWGWAGAPWWGYYGGWWAPYPVYAGPWFWLTDYLIAQQLQAAYAARYDAAAGYDEGPANYGSNSGPANYSNNGSQPANSQVTLSPEVKEAIAEEVKAQLQAQEQQAPTQGIGSDSQGPAAPANSGDQVPPALDPARRTFVVDNAITAVSDGQECELTGGDVITRLTDSPDAQQKVTASVSASKKGECGEGKQIAVSVDALQEMHNHFEEQVNNGLKALAEKQGTNGMPKAPETGTMASDLPAPQPDQSAGKTLSDQQAQADQVEAQAKQDAASAPGGGGR